MKIGLFNIYGVAQKIASIAEGETRISLTTEIVRLTIYLQTGKTVYVTYNKKEKHIYSTISEEESRRMLNVGFELIMIIEKSKELNKYKIIEV
uniref:Uncharacterized protein n=1 Tax=Dulem virus 214 TaxID=3145691 RepID=A0AAU8AV34_9VIRU